MKTIFLNRAGEITATADGEERRFDVVISSETPVKRWVWFDAGAREVNEILVHDSGSVDLGWFGSGRAPVLLDHDQRQQVGVLEDVRLDGRKLVGRLRFSRSQKAQEVRQDVEDGIRTSVSVGYSINEIDEDALNERSELRATRWTPKEASVVSIPADESAAITRGCSSDPIDLGRGSAGNGVSMTTEKKPENPAHTEIDPKEIEASRNAKMEAESKRVEAILTEGRRWMKHELAANAVRNGTSVEEFRGSLLMTLSEEGVDVAAKTSMGLTTKEKRAYSLCRLIDSMAGGSKEAGFEREISDEMSKRVGKDPRGLYVPHEVLGTRALAATAGATGGTDASALVGTDHLGASFIDILQENMVLASLGVTMLRGLEGNVAIPKQTGQETASWLNPENAAVTATDATFSQVSLSPKDLAVGTSMTRRLVQQSDPSVEGIVRRSIVRRVAQGIDKAGINGSGSAGQPQGVIGASNVGAPTLSATPTYAEIRNFIRLLMASNAGGLPGKAWLVNAAGMNAFMGTFLNASASDRPLFELTGDGEGRMLGYRAMISENVPGNLGAGTNEDGVIFGAWSELIMGLWGGLDIISDQYTSARSGQINVTVFQTVDFAIAHPEAFAVGSAAF